MKYKPRDIVFLKKHKTIRIYEVLVVAPVDTGWVKYVVRDLTDSYKDEIIIYPHNVKAFEEKTKLATEAEKILYGRE